METIQELTMYFLLPISVKWQSLFLKMWWLLTAILHFNHWRFASTSSMYEVKLALEIKQMLFPGFSGCARERSNNYACWCMLHCCKFTTRHQNFNIEVQIQLAMTKSKRMNIIIQEFHSSHHWDCGSLFVQSSKCSTLIQYLSLTRVCENSSHIFDSNVKKYRH